MEELQKMLPKLAKEGTKPEIPRKIRLKSRIFGKTVQTKYLWNYYQEESESRIPFYLPYIYRKEIVDIMRRYGQISRRQMDFVLIDGGDQRTEYFLYDFLEKAHFLTIITDRREYFEGLQERAFQELGTLIELVLPWEEKKISGNLLWDFSQNLQSPDCYPQGSICFLPHKKPWKIRETLRSGENITVMTFLGVCNGKITLPVSLAESLWIPRNLPFRKSRCDELEKWCKEGHWEAKIGLEKHGGKCAGNLENP